MLNTKSSVKLLRRAGLVLVALPEAVTTPIGVAFLLTARFISKKIEADLYKRLHGTFQHYLAHTRRTARGDADESNAKKKTIEHHALQNTDRLIPKLETPQPLITGAKAQQSSSAHREESSAAPAQKKTPVPKADSGPLIIKGQRGPEVKPVHHDVDTKWLSRRYAPADSQSPAASEANQDSAKKAEHHGIDRQKIAKRFGISEGPKTEAVRKDGDNQSEDKSLPHHNIDRQKIARRFGITSASKETPRKDEDKNEDEAEKNSIRHDIDRQKIARRFNLESGETADAASADTNKKAANIKAKAPVKKPETEDDKPKDTHHKIDAASLRRRYGGTAPR